MVIGAHRDSVSGGPGADDNASGVAVVLETARLPADSPDAPRIVLPVFDMEELGPMGSRQAARYRLRGVFPEASAASASSFVSGPLLRDPRPDGLLGLLGLAVPPADHLGLSDDAPSRYRGVPALMLTDTGHFRNPTTTGPRTSSPPSPRPREYGDRSERVTPAPRRLLTGLAVRGRGTQPARRGPCRPCRPAPHTLCWSRSLPRASRSAAREVMPSLGKTR